MPNESSRALRGVLHFFSETGTEGGLWAFMDERFITPNTTRFSCTKCFVYWDKEDNPDGPIVVTHVIPFDRALQSLENPPPCPPNEHDFQSVAPENWLYEGLRILKNGDRLTIFDKNDPARIVWSGVINLREHPLFTEHVFGMWIHADQQGLNRETWARWFLEENPAEFILASP